MASRSLGALTLDLLIKTGAFVAGMDKAERATLKSTKAMQKRLDDFAKGIGKAVGAATIAGAALGALFIKNTLEAEKAQAQLAAVLKSTGGAAGLTAIELNKMAQSLQAVTTFDDDAITGAQSLLLTFTNIGSSVFPAATKAILDMSQALGQDLKSSAIQIGKALNDPIQGISALQRVGVAFTADQKAVIEKLVETGNAAEAQTLILRELQKEFGGSAEAARNTLGGALTALKNTFNNLLEGDSGGEGMKGAISAVNSFNDSLNDPAIKSGIDAIAGAVAGITAELVSGIAQFANYISRARELSALANDPNLAKSADLDILNERIGENAQQRRRVQNQRTSVLGIDLPSLVAERKQALKDLDAERLTLQREVTKRIKADQNSGLFDGVSAKVLRDPVPTGGGTGGGGSRGGGSSGIDRAAAEAAKQAEEAARAIREAQEAQYDWHQTVLDMQASLEGPVAEVNRDYQKQIDNLDAAFAAGEVTLGDYARAQELITEQRDRSIQRIDDELTPYEEVNAAIQEQIALLGMNAEQQEIYNNLKAAGVEANSAFGQSIIQTTQDLQALRETQGILDDFKEGLSDAFADFITGSKTAKEAFGDFMDDLFKRAVQFTTDKAIDALFSAFGGQGQTGAKSGGGTDWMAIIAGFFGGGKASGGPVKPWSMYEVNESGMEGLTVGGRDYLLTGAKSGMVTPANKMGGAVYNLNNTFVVPPGQRQRTQEQQAQKMGQQVEEITRRNS